MGNPHDNVLQIGDPPVPMQTSQSHNSSGERDREDSGVHYIIVIVIFYVK